MTQPVKITEEINHYTGKSWFIGMTDEGEEITDYFETREEAEDELQKLTQPMEPKK